MAINRVANINFGSNRNNLNSQGQVENRSGSDSQRLEAAPTSVKRAALLSSVAGVGVTSAIIAKKQGFSLNPKVIFSQSPKEWAMLKIFNKNKPNEKLMEIEEPQILMLASGSAAGGLVGGAIADDKKYFKGKVRETVNQLLGNVLVPVACVSVAARCYNKHRETILKHVPQIKSSKPLMFNKFLKAVPSLAMTVASLGVGIIGGNKLSNFINEKVYHKKVDRDIKTTDFAPHVDDLSMAVTLMADKSALSTSITRTVPGFLCVPGYQIGIHRD